MGRRVKPENQASIVAWSDQSFQSGTPDKVMHAFLDDVKELEVAWFTSDHVEEVTERMARVQVMLYRVAAELGIELQDEVDGYMDRKRKER